MLFDLSLLECSAAAPGEQDDCKDLQAVPGPSLSINSCNALARPAEVQGKRISQSQLSHSSGVPGHIVYIWYQLSSSASASLLLVFPKQTPFSVNEQNK